MTFEIRLILLAALAVGLLAGFHAFVAGQQKIGYERCQTEHAKADEQARVQREQNLAEVAREAQRMEIVRERNASDLASAAARLRNRVARAVQQECNSTSTPGSEAASAPTGVCTELLSKADERLRLLAATADASYDAGKACERSYDSLNRKETE